MPEPPRTPTPSSHDARRAAYEELAGRVGGQFIEGKMVARIGVAVEHDGRTLTLGLHPVQTGMVTQLHTRVLALFQGRERLRLSVRPKTRLDRMASSLGLGGLQVAGRRFGERFVVRGRPAARVRSVMSAGLAAAVDAARDTRVAIGQASWRHRRRLGSETHRLEVLLPRMESDVDRLAAMLEVAREGIDALVRVGVASAERRG
jgi:hypothetical protein